MKTLKIVLALIVLGGIGFFIYQSLGDEQVIKSTELVDPVKGYTGRIESALDSLKDTPKTKLNNKVFDATQESILTFYNNNRLTEKEKNNFSKKLLEAYSNNLIAYSKHTFKKDRWNSKELNEIKDELLKIRNSEYLGIENNIVHQLDEIDAAINKYNEINNFIYSTTAISSSIYSTQEKVSTSSLKDKLNRANLYLANNLENRHVANCRDLRDRLKMIPENMLNSQVEYLAKKLNHWSGKYKDASNFPTQRDYANKIYKPLNDEVKEVETFLINNLNGIPKNIIGAKFDPLFEKLDQNNNVAYLFYSVSATVLPTVSKPMSKPVSNE